MKKILFILLIVVMTIVDTRFMRAEKPLPTKDSNSIATASITISPAERDSLNRIYKLDKYIVDTVAFKAISSQRYDKLVNGFRICVYTGTSQDARERSSSAKGIINELFPALWNMVSYEAPVFKVLVGACLDKTEATILLSKIRKHFPSAFIVSSKVPLEELLGTPSFLVPEVEPKDTFIVSSKVSPGQLGTPSFLAPDVKTELKKTL